MELTEFIKIGEINVKEFLVKSEDTADYIGNTGVIVLSTPSMIRYMEDTSAHILVDKLPAGYRPVGTKIDVAHIGPTPIGGTVTVKATLTAIEKRKLTYDVAAYYGDNKIGFGSYQQHVISLEKFINKNNVL